MNDVGHSVAQIYRQEDGFPEYGNLEDIRRQGRRRRKRNRTAVASALVAAAAIVVAVPRLPTDPPAPSVADHPTPTPTPRETWKGESMLHFGVDPFVDAEVSSAAPAGTVAYRRCDPSCTLTLTSPGTSPVDVGKKIPRLQPVFEEADLALATLSFDAQWIGIPDGQNYVVAHLQEDGEVLRVPSAPVGERWEPVGWTLGSSSLALMRTGPAGVSGFALVENGHPEFNQHEVHVLSTNPLPGWQPFDNGGDSVVVVQPTSDVMLSRLNLRNVFISSDQFEDGDHRGGDSTPPDYSKCLGPNETLRSPSGFPILSTPPTSKSPYEESEGAFVGALLVFDVRSNLVTGVIGRDCSRYDVPGAAADGLVVPRTTDSSHVVVQDEGSTRVLLVKAPGAGAKVVFESQGETEVVLPGASANLTG